MRLTLHRLLRPVPLGHLHGRQYVRLGQQGMPLAQARRYGEAEDVQEELHRATVAEMVRQLRVQARGGGGREERRD